MSSDTSEVSKTGTEPRLAFAVKLALMIRKTISGIWARKYLVAGAAVMAGVGAVGLMVSHRVMLATSTPSFCSSCHEIRPAYEGWLMSSHRMNERGVVVKCIDCHLPDPSNFPAFYWAKTHHGIKDIYAHFFGGEYNREEAQRRARSSIPNERCQRCHADLLATGMTRGAMLAHRSLLYPKRKGYEKTCHECHENLVHQPQAYYQRASAR